MKTKRTIAMAAVGLLMAATVVWAADQNQSSTNDQSPAYSQSPGNDNGTAYGHRGQYARYYGCGRGGAFYQERDSNAAAPSDAPRSFWRSCVRWFGWMNPWHHRRDRAAYSGRCW